MKQYTNYLVRGESNIAEMVENTEAILAQEQLPKAEADNNFEALEKELLGDLLEEDDDDASAD